MNTKHTPGPWTVRGHDDPDTMEIWDNLGAFASCESRNARLIAAAPELLEALKRAVEQFDYTVKSMTLGHTVSISSLQNCSAMARQAIAKATGGKE